MGKIVSTNSEPSNNGHIANILSLLSYLKREIRVLKRAFPISRVNFSALTDEQKIKLGISNTKKGKDILLLIRRARTDFLGWFARYVLEMERIVTNDLQTKLRAYYTPGGAWPKSDIDTARQYNYQAPTTTSTR